MHGPHGMRSDRPSFDFVSSRGPYWYLDSLLIHAPEPNRDTEHIHSIEWAFIMLRSGRKVRKKSWPSNQYAFLYRRNGKLYGNTLIIDEEDLKKISDSFSTLILRADSSDESCMPLGDKLGDITVHDWALYE